MFGAIGLWSDVVGAAALHNISLAILVMTSKTSGAVDRISNGLNKLLHRLERFWTHQILYRALSAGFPFNRSGTAATDRRPQATTISASLTPIRFSGAAFFECSGKVKNAV